MKDIKNIIIFVLAIVVLWLFFDRQSVEIKTIETIKIERDTVTNTDTIYKNIYSKPEIRYIIKRDGEAMVVPDTIEGDSIIEVANEYTDTLKTEHATAYLKILTTGALKRITGTIETKEVTTTILKNTEKTIIKNDLYFGVLVDNIRKSASPNTYIFADYTIKGKYIIGGGIDPVKKAGLFKFGVSF